MEEELGPTEVVSAETRPSEPRSEPALTRGTVVGRYLIVDRVGAGGMGTVYAAYDPTLDRKIAIKVLRSEYLDEQGKGRFQREAQAMAKLSHPSVVRVYDVGSYEDQLFIAMELVNGVTLARWLAQADRAWRDILDAMLHAGRGVAAAHDAGLVHRDVKPSNILIDEAGGVRVMDFGIARRIDADAPAPPVPDGSLGAERPMPRTQALTDRITLAGDFVGTPAYMAPEQSDGFADARTDQYSFCLTLYEALYRARPDEARVDGQVPAWLRAVVERGLSKEPAGRFPSMHELLAALSRDPGGRRRRVLAIAAALVVAGAVTALAASLAAPRPLCQGAAALASGVWDRSVGGEVSASFAGTGRPYAAETFRRVSDLLDGRVSAWVTMRTQTCEATRVRGEQSEHLLDLRMQCLDRRLSELRALINLFRRGTDSDVVDGAVQAVLKLPGLEGCADSDALTAAIPPPNDPGTRRKVDQLRSRLGEAAALEKAGRYGAALQSAIGLADEAAQLAYLPTRAEALALLGLLQARVGDAKASEATLNQAVVAAARAHDDPLVATSTIELVYVVGFQQARYAEALAISALADGAVARAAEDPVLRAELLHHLATVLSEQARYEEALADDQKSLALREQALGRDHPDVGRSLNALATTLEALGRPEEAIAAYQRSLSVFEASLGTDHPLVAAVLNNLGDLLSDQRQFEESQRLQERSLAIKERALGPDHVDVATSLQNLGLLFLRQDRTEEAGRHYERALAIQEKALGANHPAIAVSLAGLGAVRVREKRFQDAHVLLERALDIRERTRGPDHPSVANVLRKLGGLLELEGRPDEMLAHCKRALAVDEKALKPNPLIVAVDLTCVGRALLASRHPEDAIAPLTRATELQLVPRADLEDRAKTQFALARSLWEANRDRPRALELARQAHTLYVQVGLTGRTEAATVATWLRRAGP